MRKKLGPLFWGSRELKLFESVVVEIMLQELEFHIPHVQPGSYHIYERDSAGDEDLHLGSPEGPVPINKYVLLRGGSNLSFTLAAHFLVIPFFSRMVLSSVMV